MAKRLTATEKWNDPWFCELKPTDKLFWIYLIDNCNHAGIWQVNWPLAHFHLGEFIFNENPFNGRIVKLSEEKWFIPKFVEFQYGTLRDNNPAHISVIRLLTDNGLMKYIQGDGRRLLFSDKISNQKRKEVFNECDGKCVYCNVDILEEFEIDHIVPTNKMGTSHNSNLVTACKKCNLAKSDLTLYEFIEKSKLNPQDINNRLRIMKKGLYSPYVGAKDKDIAKDKDKDKESVGQRFELGSPVVYLNEKTKAHYDPKSKANMDLVRARFNEGRTLDQFKSVIDKKVSEWLTDEKMHKYLRPSTLFSRTHFEEYLNAPERGEQNLLDKFEVRR
jgi:uncharacterized phage protein (TIGR02220 family)